MGNREVPGMWHLLSLAGTRAGRATRTQEGGDVRWNVEPISPRERPSSLAVLSYSFPP